MKTAILTVVALLAVTLTACGKVEQAAATAGKDLVMVFAPGFKILMGDASAAPIQGFDECPRGNEATDGKNTCVVVTASTKQVPVLIGLSSGSVTEQWTVLRDEKNRIRLQRPDGSLVVAATPQ